MPIKMLCVEKAPNSSSVLALQQVKQNKSVQGYYQWSRSQLRQRKVLA